MEAHIFVEDSNTTAKDADLPAKEYYEGLFSVIVDLNAELEEFAETQLHILSKEYGVVDGSEPLSDIRENRSIPVGEEELMRTARTEISRAATTADVMVVLLSTDVFRTTVTQIWDELVKEAKSESIWCLGASQSALSEIDISKLRARNCSVLTYRRVGVARIGKEIRTELLEAARQKADK